jgi:hypothetical protein
MHPKGGFAALAVGALLSAAALGVPSRAQQAPKPEAAPRAAAPPAAAPVRPAAPGAVVDPALAQTLNAEVRTAPVADVLAGLSRTFRVTLDAEPQVGARRVTLRAREAPLSGLLDALGALYHTTWATQAGGAGGLYRLSADFDLQTQAAALRRPRRAAFLQRLYAAQEAVLRGNGDALAASLQDGLAQREPYLPDAVLNGIDGTFLAESLLLLPLRGGLGSPLLASAAAGLPLARVPPRHQSYFAEFVAGQSAGGINAAASAVSPEVLFAPRARAEYRFLYGDRWTGDVLETRVGVTDHWAVSTIASMLFDLPDYGALYPEGHSLPPAQGLEQRVAVEIDTDAQSWDQALLAVARAAGINVLSDSYLRPQAFRPPGRGPALHGTTLGETLDAISEYYGCVWWRQGDWFLFRSRMWAEEERVAVPEPALRALGADLAAGHLSDSTLDALAALTEEQLMSLRLSGLAAGRPSVRSDFFDLNEVQLARAGLALFAGMTDGQRDAARGEGLAYTSMSPRQRALFVSHAVDRGTELDPGTADRWGLVIAESVQRAPQAGGIYGGTLEITFDFGPSGTRSTQLSLRAPAPAPAPVPAAPAAPAAPPSGGPAAP